eukprot:CAMPEP_0184857182 /NCGR_PEP_ID=MMETSP0580-20130426/2350_1 /TAXON_ID=1118495 /ORGANISM="Dactyliosolen fragilissimus" /LENGTH=255 /DNA_ID=CAMNT_0027352633 /DNA_START=50 /DNA_END=814 /DNA_ORIENTATION=+
MNNRKEKAVVVLCGGGSGCVTNIICDRLMRKSEEYFLIVAGRTPMPPRDEKSIDFIHFDIFEQNAGENLINEINKLIGTKGIACGVQNKVSAVINSISTGGKISYDTTKIAYLNYVSVNFMVNLAKSLNCALVHMSSLKVGQPENFDPTQLESEPAWRGARSPYAWSKLAAELKLLNSDLQDMSLIRIGLLDSLHAKKFYTRVRVVCDFPVTITEEKDLQNTIEKAIHAKGRHIVTVEHHVESNLQFYRRMSNRW